MPNKPLTAAHTRPDRGESAAFQPSGSRPRLAFCAAGEATAERL